jgi:hypothetical protein
MDGTILRPDRTWSDPFSIHRAKIFSLTSAAVKQVSNMIAAELG